MKNETVDKETSKMDITNLSISELRTSNKGQIIASVTAYLNQFSKEELIKKIIGGNIIVNEPLITHRIDKQIDTYSITIQDTVTGMQLERHMATYTYYPTGELDTIAISYRNAVDIEMSRIVIKHYLDKRLPEVIK